MARRASRPGRLFPTPFQNSIIAITPMDLFDQSTFGRLVADFKYADDEILGDYQGNLSMPQQSGLREHPRYRDVMKSLLDEDMTVKEAARLLDTSEQNMWHHVQRYMVYLRKEASKRTDVPAPDIPGDYTTMLRTMITQLYDKVQSMLHVVDQERPTYVIQQLRGLIHELAEIEGKISTQPVVQLNVVLTKYEKLTAFLATKLPPEYQQIIVEFIESLEALEAKAPVT